MRPQRPGARSIVCVAFAAIISSLAPAQQPTTDPQPAPSQADVAWRDLVQANVPDERIGLSPYDFAIQSPRRAQLPIHREALARPLDAPNLAYAVSEPFLVHADNTPELVRNAFALLGATSNPKLPPPPSEGWGVPWIPEGLTPSESIRFVLARRVPDGLRGLVLAGPDERAWRKLPESVQRLVIRLYIAADHARPWLRDATHRSQFAAMNLSDPSDADELEPEALFAFLNTPFVGPLVPASDVLERRQSDLQDEEDRVEGVQLRRRALDFIDGARYDDFAIGAAIFLRHYEHAIAEYLADPAARSNYLADVDPLRLRTALGDIRVYGATDDEITEPAFITIDVGGSDRYTGRHAVPLSPRFPLALCLDLQGSDEYRAEEPASLAFGLAGLGILADLSGDDDYQARDAALGAAHFGVGLLIDYAGSDTYTLRGQFGLGAARAGLGAVIDLGGADTYTAARCAQGFAGPRGVGALIDLAGDDTYEAAPYPADAHTSQVLGDPAPAFVQAATLGRQADSADGQSADGGIALLIDEAGDDIYDAAAWSLAAGYQGGLAIFDDRRGDDRYTTGPHALAAASRHAAACFLEGQGNDRYNADTPPRAAASTLAPGHTLAAADRRAVAIVHEAQGDDTYTLGSASAAFAANHAAALFREDAGADTYTRGSPADGVASMANAVPPASGGLPRQAPSYAPPTVALFLDAQGQDAYTNLAPAANTSQWRRYATPDTKAAGADTP
ncbi:MAG: hypothetical protein AAF138_06710 [Planctomycetota bacterium]